MRFCRKNNLSPYFWTHRGCRATDVTAHGGSAERRQGHGRGIKASAKVPYSTFIYIRVRARGGGGRWLIPVCDLREAGGAWRRTKKKPQHLLASVAARIEIGDYALFRVCLNAAVTNLASQCEVSDR